MMTSFKIRKPIVKRRCKTFRPIYLVLLTIGLLFIFSRYSSNSTSSNEYERSTYAYSSTTIPEYHNKTRLIHMPVRDKNNLNDDMKTTIQAWKTLNPNYKVILYDDIDMRKLIVESYPEFLGLYDSMTEPVERVDIWRYLIVHAKGGLYSDSDWKPEVPIDEWIPRLAGRIQTLESRFDNGADEPNSVIIAFEDWEGTYKKMQFLQWGFYAALPGHPIFYKTVEHIADSFVDELLRAEYRGDAVFRTGQVPFTWAILRHLQREGGKLKNLERHQTYRFKEILIIDCFELRGYLHMPDKKPFVWHLFGASWKDHRAIKSHANGTSDVSKADGVRYRFDYLQNAYWSGDLPPI